MQRVVTLGVAGLLLATAARAQTPAAPAPSGPTPLAVGAQAPDFALPGATRYGVLDKPVRLSDFKGKTVVSRLLLPGAHQRLNDSNARVP